MKLPSLTLISPILLFLFIGCGGGSSDDSDMTEMMSEEAGSSDEIEADIDPADPFPAVQGEWFGTALTGDFSCVGNADHSMFNFDFGVNQDGGQVTVHYGNFCVSSQDEAGSVTETGFVSAIEKMEGCGGGVEAIRTERTELSNISGNSAEVRITFESTCPESPCFREWVATVTRSTQEQFVCQ